MDTLFKCIIELPKFPIKKNSKQIFKNRATGNNFIGSNSKAQYLMNYLNAQLMKEKLKNRIDTIEDEINVEMVFGFPHSVYFTKQGKRSNKVGDLSNLFEAVSDGLQKVGIISNDANINGFNGSKRIPVDDNYILKIVITKAV